MSECTVERFLSDIRNHKLTILKDDGVYRHLRLQREGSWVYGFDIITYPGHLVISGDMGATVFARINDMFRFFREDITPTEIRINPGYWREKIKSGRDDVYTFTEEAFRRQVMSNLEDIKEDVENFADLIESIEDDIFSHDGEHDLRRALADFEWQGEPLFSDTWEWDFCEYKFHYIWQCYAIVWAIAQYDLAKNQEAAV
ncbi:MAG: hypothetical protein WCO60_19720 [Verrucomicrobiota bacterium]